MTDRIIYDKAWLHDYLCQLNKYKDYLRIIKDSLFQAKYTLSPEQIELYTSIMEKLDKAENNFQIMHHTIERFMDEAQINALELTRFSEEQNQRLLFFM